MSFVDVPCTDCEQGKHDRCDGEAWNNEFECVVDCACLVCTRRTIPPNPEWL